MYMYSLGVSTVCMPVSEGRTKCRDSLNQYCQRPSAVYLGPRQQPNRDKSASFEGVQYVQKLMVSFESQDCNLTQWSSVVYDDHPLDW